MNVFGLQVQTPWKMAKDKIGVERDPLGNRLSLDQMSLEQYIASGVAPSDAGKLRGANVYSAGDRPGYSPEAGITDLYAGYYNWLKVENERIKKHEEYVALTDAQPGRKQNILGGGDTSFKPILGGAV